jgi:hypothetical protein
VFFFILNSTESEPREFASKLAIVCGNLNKIQVQISSAHRGSDSRMGHHKEKHLASQGVFLYGDPSAKAEPRKLKMAAVRR